MTDLTALVDGPAKKAIIRALQAADGPVHAGDLCEIVFGDREKRNRDTMRNLVAQMRMRLSRAGYAIHGRNELRMNAYVLVNTLLE